MRHLDRNQRLEDRQRKSPSAFPLTPADILLRGKEISGNKSATSQMVTQNHWQTFYPPCKRRTMNGRANRCPTRCIRGIHPFSSASAQSLRRGLRDRLEIEGRAFRPCGTLSRVASLPQAKLKQGSGDTSRRNARSPSLFLSRHFFGSDGFLFFLGCCSGLNLFLCRLFFDRLW